MIRRADDSSRENGETPAIRAAEAAPRAALPAAEGPAFRPRVPSFSGPLDLLLYLIHKNEVDIFDIPIARILDQYLEHLALLERNGLLELEKAGEFLVMASRLMEIKSRLLLPDVQAAEDEGVLEEELEDPRLSLVEQLLEYRRIKERAVMLEEAHTEWAARYDRPVTELPRAPDTLDLHAITVLDLCTAFERVLEESRRDTTRVIPYDDTPIEVVIQRIQEKLRATAGGTLSLRSLLGPEMGCAQLISHFLALLEMARVHLVWIAQEQDFGDIVLTLRVLP